VSGVSFILLKIWRDAGNVFLHLFWRSSEGIFNYICTALCPLDLSFHKVICSKKSSRKFPILHVPLQKSSDPNDAGILEPLIGAWKKCL
jgi:hypothetical protein